MNVVSLEKWLLSDRVGKEQDELGIDYWARRKELAQIMIRICQRDIGVSLTVLLLTQPGITGKPKVIVNR